MRKVEFAPVLSQCESRASMSTGLVLAPAGAVVSAWGPTQVAPAPSVVPITNWNSTVYQVDPGTGLAL